MYSPRKILAALLGAVLLLGAGQQPASAAPDTAGARTAPGRSPAGQLSLTLLTGDRISVLSADAKQLAVRPAKGREHVRFTVERTHDSVYVIPSDAQRLVRAGTLDRRLFDVAGLVRAGYADSARDTLPLIVQYGSGTGTGTGAARRAAGTLATSGARVTRDLPAIDGAAVLADKSAAAAFWAGLTGGAARPEAAAAGGIAKIWLDGKRRISLDVSVPQIGAPAAWQAGYTGRGVTVAVLDTGIDTTHPDLAGKVAESVDFSGVGLGDTVGHGTHVASTIAGSGAASGGKYRGVAPDATLVSGKVCADSYCEDSAILAGMQWAAAEKHATAVNLSLGGPDSPGIDPLEEAVNTLTAQYGTLFVIAAGNDGTVASIGSPSSADAALSVGAVDKSDQLADFSSRGPRVGDDAVKPDLTAPGVDIVAARADGTELGEPVGEDYVSLSGTSMATPHVAGSVALLAQQHPDWKAGQFKATLVGSAKPNPKLSAYEQGAGRVDVAAAITRTVTSDPVSVSFGRAVWPHADDTPIARTVSYRNSGPDPVTFALSVAALGPDGAAAPAGLFTVSADTVIVPAGGHAEVTVTADTRGGTVDGTYSGNLLATAGQTVVATPIGVNKEVESYDLTITTLDNTGHATADAWTLLLGLDQDLSFMPFSEEGVTTIRVPRGRYNLTSVVATWSDPATPPDNAFLAQPALNLTRDTAITLDARAGRPVRTTVPEPTARVALVDLTMVRHTRFGDRGVGLWSDTFEGLTSAQIGPAVPASELVTTITSQWALPGANGRFEDSPYLYAVGDSLVGTFPTGYARAYRPGEFATARQEFGVGVPGLAGERVVFPAFEPEVSASAIVLGVPQGGHRVEYHNTDRIRWASDASFGTYDEDGWLAPETYLAQAPVTYRAGRSYRDEWNTGPFGPTFPEPLFPEDWVSRQDDTIMVDVPLYGDRGGHAGFSNTDTAHTALYRDGKLVGETDGSGYGVFEVPAAKAGYRLELADTRSVGDLSTRVAAVWTFRSGHVGGESLAKLPVAAVRLTPALDASGSAPAGRRFDIPVSVARQPGAPAARTRTLGVEVSYDDGKTWQRATVRGGVATVRHPAAAGYVSLRASAADTAGNTVTETIIHAYRIR